MNKETRNKMSYSFTQKWLKDRNARPIGHYQAHNCLLIARLRAIGMFMIMTLVFFAAIRIYSDKENDIVMTVITIIAPLLLLSFGNYALFVHNRKKSIGNLGLKMAKDWSRTFRRLKRLRVRESYGCTNTLEVVNNRLFELGREVAEYENKQLPRHRAKTRKQFIELESLAKNNLGLELSPRNQYFPMEIESVCMKELP